MRSSDTNRANWLPGLEHIETSRLILRPLTLGDLNDVYAYASDPEVARYTIFDFHTSIQPTREFLASVIEGYAEGHPGPWGAENRQTKRVIGAIGLRRWSRENASAELGFALKRASWNQGFASEMVRAVIDFGFQRMALNRLCAGTMTANSASRHVLEKAGMKFEGVLRQVEYFKNGFQDVALYSMLREEWSARA